MAYVPLSGLDELLTKFAHNDSETLGIMDIDNFMEFKESCI